MENFSTKEQRLANAAQFLIKIEQLIPNPQVLDDLYEYGKRVNELKAYFPWRLVMEGPLAWECFRGSATYNDPVLYCLFPKEVVDFIQAHIANYQGLRMYYLLTAAFTLTKYNGLSYQEEDRIEAQIYSLARAVKFVKNGLTLEDLNNARGADDRKQFVIAKELINGDKLKGLYLSSIALGNKLPSLIAHESENNANSWLFYGRRNWQQRFIESFSDNRFSNRAGRMWSSVAEQMLDIPQDSGYIAEASGFHHAMCQMKNIFTGTYSRLPIRERVIQTHGIPMLDDENE